MKKTLLSFVLITAILCSLPAVPAMAAESPARPSASARAERLERRQVILELRISLQENHLACLRQVRSNNLLRMELWDLLKDSKGDLSPETIEALKNLNSQVKEITGEIRETSGDIRRILDDLRRPGEKPTLEEIQAAYEKIGDLQAQRLACLTEINGLLQQMIDLLQI